MMYTQKEVAYLLCDFVNELSWHDLARVILFKLCGKRWPE